MAEKTLICTRSFECLDAGYTHRDMHMTCEGILQRSMGIGTVTLAVLEIGILGGRSEDVRCAWAVGCSEPAKRVSAALLRTSGYRDGLYSHRKPDGKERTARDSMLSEPDPAYPESLNAINLNSKRTTARPVTILHAPIPRVVHSSCVNRSVTFLLTYGTCEHALCV